MQEFIVDETNKIFKKAIKRYAKKDAIDTNKVSILLSLDAEKEVVFSVCHNFQPVKVVGIMDILGVLIDLKGYSFLVPPQIQNILLDFESELKSELIAVGVFLNPSDDDEILYFLFDNAKKVKDFALSDVLKLEIT
jgi:hypothetical protein